MTDEPYVGSELFTIAWTWRRTHLGLATCLFRIYYKHFVWEWSIRPLHIEYTHDNDTIENGPIQYMGCLTNIENNLFRKIHQIFRHPMLR